MSKQFQSAGLIWEVDMFVESKQALAGLLAKLVEFLTHQFPLPVIGLEYHIQFFFPLGLTIFTFFSGS